MGVEGFVGDQCIGLHCRQQVIGPDEIMGFTTSQVEVGGVSERVDGGVDFAAQPSARAADGLVRAGFFWAPALC